MIKNNYKYFWVIGGGILQIPLIHEVKKLNYSVIVTDGNPDCICKKQAEIFECIDIYDISKQHWFNFIVSIFCYNLMWKFSDIS